MYSFMHFSFKLFKIGELRHQNVRGALLHLKVSGPFVQTFCIEVGLVWFNPL